ncbi:MAG: hypothetical protein MUE41_15675 [Gemmatimonadaceae bacterium]|jgi:hypothetical protein|nr:hypothetical protein [Gemmatimonadaceae bacterium]
MHLSDADIDRVLTAIGATPSPVRREGARVALTYFARYAPHLSVATQHSYLRAMDLSRPVDTVDLHAGDRVAAFRHHTADWGEFYTPLGSDPTKLGVLLEGRQYREYEVARRIPALRSRTSAFMHEARGSGGAVQLIIPQASLHLRVSQRGLRVL